MSVKDQIPCNTDLLQSAKFILSFPRISTTQFFCQSANIPGISSGFAMQNTMFSDLPIPGDKINYETFNIEFLLDEELQSWRQIHDWIRGLVFPEEFEEYKNLKNASKYSQQMRYPQYADAELIVLGSNNLPTIKIHIIEAFPVSVSGIDFDIRLGSERTLSAIATFKFKRYDIVKA
jgi:hypothetical protein